MFFINNKIELFFIIKTLLHLMEFNPYFTYMSAKINSKYWFLACFPYFEK
jgi:hypothetical protein